MGWPEGAGGYEAVRKRGAWLAHRSREVGARQAHDEVRAVSGQFGWWLRSAWSSVVTGNDGSAVAKLHHGRGVDVKVSFWTDKAAELRDRPRIVWYVAREVGKKYQKTPLRVGGR